MHAHTHTYIHIHICAQSAASVIADVYVGIKIHLCNIHNCPCTSAQNTCKVHVTLIAKKCTYIYTYTHTYTHAYAHENTCTCMTPSTRWNTDTKTHNLCTNMHTHTHTHVYKRIDVHIHTYMHIYTYIMSAHIHTYTKRVLKDFRWFIRHHSSVVESAALKKFSNPQGSWFESGRKHVTSDSHGFEHIDPQSRVLNYCFQK